MLAKGGKLRPRSQNTISVIPRSVSHTLSGELTPMLGEMVMVGSRVSMYALTSSKNSSVEVSLKSVFAMR